MTEDSRGVEDLCTSHRKGFLSRKPARGGVYQGEKTRTPVKKWSTVKDGDKKFLCRRSESKIQLLPGQKVQKKKGLSSEKGVLQSQETRAVKEFLLQLKGSDCTLNTPT